MPQKRPTYIDKLVNKYVVGPFIVLIGMVLIGAAIDSVFKTGNTFMFILAGVGGVNAIARYYKSFCRFKLSTSNFNSVYYCNDCHKKFIGTDALPNVRVSPNYIVNALNEFYNGMSFRHIENNNVYD
jgi:hypothetical protein